MPAKQPTSPRKVGRPASGVTRSKITVSIPIPVAKEAAKRAAKNNESLSQFASRAIQNLLLNS